MPFYSLPSGASPVLAGTSPPTGGVGNVGDLFLDTANAILYGPKDLSGWPSGIDLSQGPTGPIGATGLSVTGPTGAASTVTGPTGAASTVTGPTGAASTVTGPTGAASTVTGPQGQTGPSVTGPTGGVAFAATGATAPNLNTAGAIWLDTTTGRYFVLYDEVFIEVGVQGEQGPTGATGAVGPPSDVAGPTGAEGPTGPSGGPTGPTGAQSSTGPTGGFSAAQEINAQTTGYTLVASDAGRLITMEAATGVQVVIPAIASVAFPTGTHVDLLRLGTGPVTVTGATGVTVNGTPGRSLRAVFSSATCIHYVGDTWVVVGDLS